VQQRAKAPTRIDLAGGTLDIWPLWNIIPGSITVNVAIRQYTTVTIEDKGTPDEGFPRFIAENIAETCGLKEIPALKIKADYPVRMGLGGSSSALIASLWCFEHFRKLPVKELIQACANLESKFLKTPTGVQDYYPPLLGGVNAINFDYQGPRHEQLKPGTRVSDILTNGIMLVRGRGQHASGNINWQVVKNAIDGDETTLSILHRYAGAGKKARESILKDDVNGLFSAINEDMLARMEFGEIVVPGYFKDLYEKIKGLGTFAGKICGAGGDSCLALFCKPQDAERLKSYLKSEGWEVLPTSLSTTGVTLEK
jgi:D-glycero-alpha-D-manno-heptose-7-phosphate kinase